jgi:hypothetical protein
LLANELIWREGLETAGEVVSRDKVSKVSAQLIMIVVVISLDRRFLDGAVHPFDLTVGPYASS